MRQKSPYRSPDVVSTDAIAHDSAKVTSPLISIWARPRATIRHIVATNPRYRVLTLAVLTGIAEIFGNIGLRDFGKEYGLPLTLLFVLGMGSILGVLILYGGGKLLHWSGRWLGGRASLEEIRCALAWSTVPRIATLPILLVAILFNGQVPGLANTSLGIDDQRLVEIGVFIAPIILLDFWSVVLASKCLGEVQRFSALKALGNIAMVVLSILLPIAVAAGVLRLLSGH